jgi:tryptophanyl-tRNA synthetase
MQKSSKVSNVIKNKAKMDQPLPEKPRVLTGDTPTGRLHLGHWLGSVKTRIALQDSYDCYFIIANYHAFTIHPERTAQVYENTLAITLDYLAAGIDPEKSTIFIQSEVPALAALTYWLSMLLPFSRVMRNPTVKAEIRTKKLEDRYTFGFLLYPVGQVADILAFRPERVPVGADQIPLIEMTNEVARRFNQLYCGVDPQTPDALAHLKGGVFPVIQAEPMPPQRLVGIGPPNAAGQLPKMSKSLDNAIYLHDSPNVIQQKVMQMYTDPKRVRASDPGTIENNPLWILQDAFNPDTQWVTQAKGHYREGKIGDVACKQRLVEVLVELTRPMRERYLRYAKEPDIVKKILKMGTEKANEQANKTLKQVKAAMKQLY